MYRSVTAHGEQMGLPSISPEPLEEFRLDLDGLEERVRVGPIVTSGTLNVPTNSISNTVEL